MNAPALINDHTQYSKELDKLNFDEKLFNYHYTVSKHLSNSVLVPEPYRGKPENALFAISYGHSLGMSPIQSLQNIDVIKGKPGLKSVAVLGIVTPYLDKSVSIKREMKNGKTHAVTVTMQRHGVETSKSFSLDDAQTAGLMGNTGWKMYPENMLEWRAIAMCARLVCADILAGIYTDEELGGISTPVLTSKNITPTKANDLFIEAKEETEPPKKAKAKKEKVEEVIETEPELFSDEIKPYPDFTGELANA